MIVIASHGSTPPIDEALKKMSQIKVEAGLKAIGEEGLLALQAHTPVDTGRASDSWYYDVDISNGKYTITWSNFDVDVDGVPIVIMLEYGHATGTGGWVEGRDFVNPAIQPIFDQFIADIWSEVKNAR